MQIHGTTSLFDLQGLFKLANSGQYLGIDLWHYKTPSRSGLQTALDYLLPYALKNTHGLICRLRHSVL